MKARQVLTRESEEKVIFMEHPRPERAWFERSERAKAEVSERARWVSERLLKITF